MEQQDWFYHIVVNPAGASGRTGRKWKKAEQVFRDAGVGFEVHFSEPSRRIGAVCREITEKAAPGEILNIVIVGGDGSVNDAVNGIGHPENVRLGFIPAGSGNDLGRDLGIGNDVIESARRILACREPRPVDIGELTVYERGDLMDPVTLAVDPQHVQGEHKVRFMISSGIGFDAAICQFAQVSPLKKVLNFLHLGKLIYLSGAIKLIFTHRNFTMDMVLDGTRKVHVEHCLFGVFMNHRYEGGGFCFCPHAADQDGKLDILYADPDSNMAFFRIFPTAYSGKHLRFACVHEDRCSEAEVQVSRYAWMHTDGEVGFSSDRFRMAVLQEKINMLL